MFFGQYPLTVVRCRILNRKILNPNPKQAIEGKKAARHGNKPAEEVKEPPHSKTGFALVESIHPTEQPQT